MDAEQTFEQLKTDIEKAVNAIRSVKSLEEFRIQGRNYDPDYLEHQEKHLHEYWIALSLYSFSAQLSYLAFVVNAIEPVVPAVCKTKEDLADFYTKFTGNKEKVLASFNRIINKPNQVFVTFNEATTMENFLEKVVTNINDEALNLEYNYNEFSRL